jgi:hypothetical protein
MLAAASSSSASDPALIRDTRDIRDCLFLFVRDMMYATSAILERIRPPQLDSYSTSLFLADKISFAFLCVSLRSLWLDSNREDHNGPESRF